MQVQEKCPFWNDGENWRSGCFRDYRLGITRDLFHFENCVWINQPISKSFSHTFAPIAISLITDVCCVSLIIFWIQFSIWLHIIVDCGLDFIVLRYYQLYWVLVILFLLRILSESDVIQFYFSLFFHCFRVIILAFPTCFIEKVLAIGNSGEINNRFLFICSAFEWNFVIYVWKMELIDDYV